MSGRDIKDLDPMLEQDAKEVNYEEVSTKLTTWLVIAGMVIVSYFLMALPAAMDKIVESLTLGKV